MDIGLGDYRELASIRMNVRRSVQSLELCLVCQRLCECKESFVNKDAQVWVCDECFGKFSAMVGGVMAVSVERDPPGHSPDPSSLRPNDFESNLAVSARTHVWMRQCPQCKSAIEKRDALDPWKCPRCGWE